MEIRNKLSLSIFGDVYNSATYGLVVFVLVETDLKPLTEQIDFRGVWKTH